MSPLDWDPLRRIKNSWLSATVYRSDESFHLGIFPSENESVPMITLPAATTADDSSLENPIFQECFARPNRSGGELFFVGQCRRRYFSAVLTVTEQSLDFEVADRFTQEISFQKLVMTLDWRGSQVETASNPLPYQFQLVGLTQEGQTMAGTESNRRAVYQLSAFKPTMAPTTLRYGFRLVRPSA